MPQQIPAWLHLIAWASVAVGVGGAGLVAMDILAGHRRNMWIMNIVWPLTVLWSGPAGLYAYRREVTRSRGHRSPGGETRSFPAAVAIAATHCGAGCTLGDLVAETATAVMPVVLLGSPVFGTWAIDFSLAFAFGIVFQYFTIAPMRHLRPAQGLIAALEADTLSLVSWQVGMYGWMAAALFVWFSPELLAKSGPVFWFMMQLAMACGFLVSYPVNWWLLRRGLKERM